MDVGIITEGLTDVGITGAEGGDLCFLWLLYCLVSAED